MVEFFSVRDRLRAVEQKIKDRLVEQSNTAQSLTTLHGEGDVPNWAMRASLYIEENMK